MVSEKLANGLEKMRGLQMSGTKVFTSGDFTRTEREELVRAGYLSPIMKGWFHASRPDEGRDNTTPWAMSFWDFVRDYCQNRFGEEWVVSADSSLNLMADDLTPPKILTVLSPQGNNKGLSLPHGFKVFMLKGAVDADKTQILKNGVRCLTDVNLLLQLDVRAYQDNPINISAILARMDNVDLLSHELVANNKARTAGHVLAALEKSGQDDKHARMKSLFLDMGFRPKKGIVNDYVGITVSVSGEGALPNRLRGMWERNREVVLSRKPEKSDITDRQECLEMVADAYQRDAWHSLSIEGYTVSVELIEKVRDGDWSPDSGDEDKKHRGAFAAKGYHDAFQSVKNWIGRALDDPNAIRNLETAQREWHELMFRPTVKAGILKPHQIIGYRNHPVFIRTAQHVPPAPEKLTEGMSTYHELLLKEDDAFVRAVLGLWLLGYVHPFPDGNGRLARFTMNAMLVSGGYDWAVVQLEEKAVYMRTLDVASCQQDAGPFADFISRCVMRDRALRMEERHTQNGFLP